MSASLPVNKYDSVCLFFCSSDAFSDVDAAS